MSIVHRGYSTSGFCFSCKIYKYLSTYRKVATNKPLSKFYVHIVSYQIKQGSPKDGYYPAIVFFKNILFFSQPDQNCTLPLVRAFEVWIRVKVTAHRLNEDNICTKLDDNPSMHT